jgi:hypothetical protein
MLAFELAVGIALTVAMAVIVLSIRDSGRQRRHDISQELRPIPDRINEVRERAQFMIRQFETILDHYPQACSDDWIPTIISFYRRLDALASDPGSSADEVIGLADEASAYIRNRRLKGIRVAEEARRLAAILSKKRAA